MIFRAERNLPNATDLVYGWWTDFREDDHHHPGSPVRSRREILRREGREVWLRDKARRPARVTVDAHVTLDPPKGYSVESRYPGADVRYAYRFDSTAEGTKITMTVHIRPRHIGWVLVPLLANRLRRFGERDLDFHIREMARDLGS